MQKVYSDSHGHCWEFYFNDVVPLQKILEYLNGCLFIDGEYQKSFNSPHTCFARATETGDIVITGARDYVFVNVTKIQPIF